MFSILFDQKLSLFTDLRTKTWYFKTPFKKRILKRTLRIFWARNHCKHL
jgi:hypothetical protein